ncbi:MAG TPA: hypothetical protein VH518_24375 [Tepidisphaeraceae bacterium]|jgi:hypothetical protein
MSSSTTDQSPTAGADAAPYVQLFQKAHQKIVLLERLDEQVMQLLGKRQELQDELRAVQTQINLELEQRIKGSGEPPAKLLGAIAGSATATRNGNGASNRFAAQAIDPVVAND